ncbi:MAG: Maf family protein [Chloroflexi bacterium]|nr:Maf family protein [Chloroflexota bacterium]MCC6894199.1 septum formation protein Maf [Anaerolineae bacterium]
MAEFILASSSPRRRELLGTLGITFRILKPDIDETQRTGEAPLAYVQRLSREKAAAVVQQLDTAVTVLAADTVVILSADTMGIEETGAILGKPADAAEARAMLRRLRGRVHQVCTAMTLLVIDPDGAQRAETRVTRTDVTMRDYTDAEIEAYIATGDPFDKAGSYAIQHPVFQPVARIDGCYSNVVGLPLCTLQTMLAAMGWLNMTPQAVCTCKAEN